jgi:hypothetical protein
LEQFCLRAELVADQLANYFNCNSVGGRERLCSPQPRVVQAGRTSRHDDLAVVVYLDKCRRRKDRRNSSIYQTPAYQRHAAGTPKSPRHFMRRSAGSRADGAWMLPTGV